MENMHTDVRVLRVTKGDHLMGENVSDFGEKFWDFENQPLNGVSYLGSTVLRYLGFGSLFSSILLLRFLTVIKFYVKFLYAKLNFQFVFSSVCFRAS